jgi:hypothetical protein
VSMKEMYTAICEQAEITTIRYRFSVIELIYM